MPEIIIADDEELERRALLSILGSSGRPELRIREARNGLEAAALAEAGPLDCAFLDVKMPGLDGLETGERIRLTHPDAAIVFITAFDSFEFARRALRLGASEYLLKPASSQEVLAALDRALGARGPAAAREAPGIWGTAAAMEAPGAPGLGGAVRAAQSALGPDATPPATGPATRPAALPAAEAGTPGRAAPLLKPGFAFAYLDPAAAAEDPLSAFLALKALEYSAARLSEPLSLETCAEGLSVSPSRLSRALSRHTGGGFADCLQRLRVDAAKDLLGLGEKSVKEVSFALGFQDPAYFAKVFRRLAGLSPAEYREEAVRGRLGGG